jgi:hypothetical protein
MDGGVHRISPNVSMAHSKCRIMSLQILDEYKKWCIESKKCSHAEYECSTEYRGPDYIYTIISCLSTHFEPESFGVHLVGRCVVYSYRSHFDDSQWDTDETWGNPLDRSPMMWNCCKFAMGNGWNLGNRLFDRSPTMWNRCKVEQTEHVEQAGVGAGVQR